MLVTVGANDNCTMIQHAVNFCGNISTTTVFFSVSAF